jgi:pyruvate formate lyase activating enzyme
MGGANSLSGVVFDVQRYSLGDGPGIRTTVFLKGCPLRCRWCQNPESFSPVPEIAFRPDRCINCGFLGCSRELALAEAPLDPAGWGRRAEVCPTKALFVIGRRYTVPELLAEVLRDAAFFRQSGGGVTLSGGEPTLQFPFVLAFLQACKQAGLHTALETSGLTDRDRFAELLPALDRIYFDLKVMAPAEHRRLTGADNHPILANARWLAETGAPVTFRVPLVPGMTATPDNIQALGRFLSELSVMGVELCPYHNTWEQKLSRLTTKHLPLGLPSLTAAETAAVVAALSQRGIAAKVSHG